MIVPPDVLTSYTKIIDSILASSDLNTISEKRIRRGLQDAIDYDITPQKVGRPFVLSFPLLARRELTRPRGGGDQGVDHAALRHLCPEK